MTHILPEVDEPALLTFLAHLLNTPSPTGYSMKAVDLVESVLKKENGLTLNHTHKGALLVKLEGQRSDAPRALTAHVDTLGAMVKTIKPNGRLTLTQIGGFAWNSIEGEGCTVFTQSGKELRGSILIQVASSHVYGAKASETPRNEETMEVRLDAETWDAKATGDLGVSVGDFVAFDPRVEITNGFVRSRHLDDKAGVACLVAAAQSLQKAGLKPLQTSYFLISNYEEVGHGAATGIPAEVTELLAVDMAAVGEGQTSDEMHATLCVKDSGGPYHFEMGQRLRSLAEEYAIPYKVDIYPHYGSDGEAYWRAGGDVAVALMGPGVDASHNYERTHSRALLATTRWVLAYLLN
jgi:putative aminopeptidase FrvX